jgi:hypothetical protein
MTIMQPQTLPDITPDKWTIENWQYILTFPQPLDAPLSFLFYLAINDAESLDEQRRQDDRKRRQDHADAKEPDPILAQAT